MSFRIISALISKDFALFFRNRFFALVTILGLVAYLVIYFVMPSSVDETLDVGLYAPVMPPIFEHLQEEGLKIAVVESEEALREAVTEGKYVAGVVLPPDIIERLTSGQKPQITVYFASDTPEEVKQAIGVVIRELAYLQAGQPLAIEVSEEILGPDMIGTPIPPRDRLRPLFAVLLIMTETFGLATLITEEVERGTIQALLVTPMTTKDLFTAKGVTGISLAFIQSILFMAIVGGINRQPVIILVTLLLGAILVTGVSFLMASLSKDMMSVMGWGVIAFILLIIPSVSIMFPGTISGWVKVIPSYYLVDTVHRAANFGSGLGAVWGNLLMLLGFDLAIVWVGVTVLRRRFR